MMISCYH